MKKTVYNFLISCICLSILSACGGYKTKKITSVPLELAKQEIPEQELMDVGITPFTSEELEREKAEEQGTHPEIRKAEQHYIPYHLKNTLQKSSHWGIVRVTPENDDGFDITVKGHILRSTGEHLELQIEVLDASGKTWFQNEYITEAERAYYIGNTPGKTDPFQSIYNAITNDMIKFKQKLEQKDIEKIRTISQLKFAREFVPDAFGEYLEDEDERLSINRLPADNDPLMKRVLKIRQRDYMYIDTLNEYYENFYNQMWGSYHSWRDANFEEQKALREVKRKAFWRKAGGAALIAVPIVFGGVFGVPFVGALMDPMVMTGGKMLEEGKHISQEVEMHSVAVQELSETFGANMKPVTMEFQGKQYTLSGTAEEQYDRWKDLMRRIYMAETGTQDMPISNENPSLGDEVVEPFAVDDRIDEPEID